MSELSPKGPRQTQPHHHPFSFTGANEIAILEPIVKEAEIAENKHQSLGYTASVTDLLPAEGYSQKTPQPSLPRDRTTPVPMMNFQMAPTMPWKKPATLKTPDTPLAHKQQFEEDPPELMERSFSKKQSKDLIAISFKSSDCYDVKQYDDLVRLVNRCDPTRQSLQLPPASKRNLLGSPNSSAAQFATTMTSKFNSKSLLARPEGKTLSPEPTFFSTRSRHKLPLPGIGSSHQPNPALAIQERQFRKKLKDLVSQLSASPKSTGRPYQPTRRKQPGAGELSPVKVKEIRSNLHQEAIIRKHTKTRSLFYEKSLRLEQEMLAAQKRALEAKRTMKPSRMQSFDVGEPRLNIKPEVSKKLNQLPNLKPIILSPHLVKMYRDEQRAARNKQ